MNYPVAVNLKTTTIKTLLKYFSKCLIILIIDKNWLKCQLSTNFYFFILSLRLAMHKSVYTIPNKYIACDKRSFGLRLEIAYQNIANFAVTLKFEGEKYIMSNTINNSRDLLPSNKPEVSMDGTTKELQHNPIFKIWLAISRVRLAPKAIATFFKKEQANSQVESQQDFHATIDSTNSTQEQYYYTRFTDRVDPSLYYTIFVSKKL